MEKRQRLCILGATGSVGISTLEVVALHPRRFEVFALSAHHRIDELAMLCLRWRPRFAVVADAVQARRLRERLGQADVPTEVLHGSAALSELAAHPEVDTVMAAIVGAAGLAPCLAAARAGKRLLLANKEALVVGGGLVHAQRAGRRRDAAADRQRAFGDLPVPASRAGGLARAHRPHRAHRLRRAVSRP
jgi:1-deoxy-D-xylulose-5-phosphate reductoisomerase